MKKSQEPSLGLTSLCIRRGKSSDPPGEACGVMPSVLGLFGISCQCVHALCLVRVFELTVRTSMRRFRAYSSYVRKGHCCESGEEAAQQLSS